MDTNQIQRALERARRNDEISRRNENIASQKENIAAREAQLTSRKHHVATPIVEPLMLPQISPAEIEFDPMQCQKQKILIAGTESEPSASSAAYRVLRTRFIQRTQANNWNTVGISSPGQGDGKSTTAINLALSVARAGNHHVFLLDFDLRRPKIFQYLGATPHRELTDYLTGTALPDDVLFSIGVPNFTIAGALSGTSEASELLAGHRVPELFSYIQDRVPNAMILLDLPPLLSTDDALIMAAKIDACLLVVSERRTRRDGAAKALELLDDYHLAGIVVNRSRSMVSGYGYYAAY